MSGVTFRLALTFVLLATICLLGYAAVSLAIGPVEQKIAIYAILSLLVIWTVLMIRRYSSIFEPLNMLVFFFLIGTIWKIPYLLNKRDALERLLAGHDVEIFLNGLLLIIAAVFAFLLGYLLIPASARLRQAAVLIKWKEGRTLAMVGLVTIIGGTAGFMALNSIGFSSLMSGFSQKRFLELEGASGRLGTALYTYYKLSLITRVPMTISFIYLLTGNRRYRKTFFVIFLIGLLVSVGVPIVFNTRGNAILTVLDIVVIAALAGFTIKKRYLVFFGGLSFAAFSYMTIARVGDRYTNALDAIIGHRYFLELTKTAQILEYFSVERIRLYGETLVGWIFVPIPSSIMPDKPLFVDLGKFIGRNIFGYDITGTPAGFVGELYINFGYAGVVVGMFVTGIITGLVWRWYTRNRDNLLVTVFTAMFVVRFAVFLFNNDFGTFMIKNLIETLPTLILLIIVASYPKSREGRSAAMRPVMQVA